MRLLHETVIYSVFRCNVASLQRRQVYIHVKVWIFLRRWFPLSGRLFFLVRLRSSQRVVTRLRATVYVKKIGGIRDGRVSQVPSRCVRRSSIIIQLLLVQRYAARITTLLVMAFQTTARLIDKLEAGGACNLNDGHRAGRMEGNRLEIENVKAVTAPAN
jgi:hypothetical protein